MRRIASASGMTVAAALAATSVSLMADESEPAKPLASNTQRDSTFDSPPVRSTAAAREADEIELARLRLREGTRLRDANGRFRQVGDSLVFMDGEGRQISGLQNLNLERVLRMLKTVEEPESITWSVSGTITEFGGRNYLLISRAVYKASAPPPVPESLLHLDAPPAVETAE